MFMKGNFEGESASEVHFFHISTDGTNNGIIHFSDKDYNQAITISAICAHKTNVDIICYCHMSTHSHWAVASQSFEQAKKFADEYKRDYARYAYLEHGERKIFKDIDCIPKEITTVIYLRNCICYILLNPVAAGIVKSPELYKWSSFSAYFSDREQYMLYLQSGMNDDEQQGGIEINSHIVKPNCADNVKGCLSEKHELIEKHNCADNAKKCFSMNPELIEKQNCAIFVRNLGTNECRRLMHTRARLADSRIMINSDGTIIPWSIVDYKLVESLFRNRTGFYRSLALTNSAVEEAKYVIRRNKYSDTEVMAECFELSKAILKKESIQWLTRDEKYRLVPHIRKRTGASPKQIARILRLKSEEVSTLLGRID